MWIGNQFREAIGLYYPLTPGAVERYPEKLEDLLEDRRYLTTARYLRQIHRDPMTVRPQWALIPARDGAFLGFHSLSDLSPINADNLSSQLQTPTTPSRYADWQANDATVEVTSKNALVPPNFTCSPQQVASQEPSRAAKSTMPALILAA